MELQALLIVIPELQRQGKRVWFLQRRRTELLNKAATLQPCSPLCECRGCLWQHCVQNLVSRITRLDAHIASRSSDEDAAKAVEQLNTTRAALVDYLAEVLRDYYERQRYERDPWSETPPYVF